MAIAEVIHMEEPVQPTESLSHESRLNAVLAAWYEEIEAGRNPDRQALLDRHPDLAADLASFFDDRERAERYLLPCSSAPVLPDRLGDYEVLEEIGRGGMGVVFRARQPGLDRVVALKTILTGRLATAEERQRFRTEAEAAASLDHPNIVPVYEVGEYDGIPYLAMRLIEGRSLADLLRDGPLDVRQAAWLLSRVAKAVDHAHRSGVLHRDLKPANILLARRTGSLPVPPADGQAGCLSYGVYEPHVADFGLARRLDGGASLTASGISGTASYIAPEQAAGRAARLTTAVDIYALGAILYECLTGRTPFVRDSLVDVLRATQEEEPPALRSLRPRIDRDLETITLKCLQKVPTRRYASALEFAEDLERWLLGEPVLARPVGQAERLWRWCRRHPLPALLAALLAVLVAGVTVASLLAANTFRELAADQKKAADDAEEARKQAVKDRDGKQVALVEAQVLKLTAQSTVALGQDQTLALLLATEAVKRGPGAISHNALRVALDECREELSLPVTEEHWDFLKVRFRSWMAWSSVRHDVRFSGDGKHLLEIGPVVKVRDGASGKVICALAPGIHPSRTRVFSPDGNFVATTHGNFHYEVTGLKDRSRKALYFTDRIVRVHEVSREKQIAFLRGHERRVNTVAFSPGGERLVTASDDQTVRVWQTEGARLRRILRLESAVRSAEFSPDGKHVLAVSTCCLERSMIYPPNIRHVGVENVVDPPDDDPRNYQYSGSGGSSGSDPYYRDNTRDSVLARVWDADTGREVASLRREALPVAAKEQLEPAFGGYSPDGRLAVTVLKGEPYRVVVWDPRTGAVRTSFRERLGPVTRAAFSSDGKLLTVTGKFVRLWDTASGEQLDTLKGHTRAITGATFSPDGRRVATASEDETCRLWDVSSGDCTAVLHGHRYKATNVWFHPDGSRLVTTANDGVIRLWRVDQPQIHLRVLRGHTEEIHTITYSPNGKRLLTGSKDCTTRIWDAASGRQLASLMGYEPYASFRLRHKRRGLQEMMVGPVRQARFISGGQRIVTLSEDSRPIYQVRPEERFHNLPWTPVRIWDGYRHREVLAVSGVERQIKHADVSADGSKLLVAEGWKQEGVYTDLNGNSVNTPEGERERKIPPIEVRIHDANTGRLLGRLKGFTHELQVASFSPDGKRVLTLSEERSPQHFSYGVLELWDAVSGQSLARYETEPPHNWRHHALFSPDGQWVFFNGKLLDGQTLTVKHEAGHFFSRFSPDGKHLLDAGGNLNIWEVETSKLVRKLRGPKNHTVEDFALSADSSRIATAGGDRTVCVWDALTGKELHTLTAHDKEPRLVAVRPDGKEVAVVCADHTIWVWSLDLLPLAAARKPRELTAEERALYLDEPRPER